MSNMMHDFMTVESVLRQHREQRERVKGKDTPFRVKFRYRRGSASYQYFETVEDANRASDRKAGYGPTGRAYVEYPLSQQIQKRGPRGGWSTCEARKKVGEG